MNNAKVKHFTIFFLLATVVIMLPENLLATTGGNEFGGAAIVTAAEQVKGYLFGPVRLFVAILAAGLGFFQAMMGNFKHMLTFFGVGIGSTLIPSFIEGVFGMMLP